MNTIDYSIALCGSPVFDGLMKQTAQKLCMDFPSLSMEVHDKNLRGHGDLDDAAYAKYQKYMFGKSCKV